MSEAVDAHHTPASSSPPPEHGPAATSRWWPKEQQSNWRQLDVATVDWLVVWNVNLGGGHDAFSVTNGHWGNHPFQPNVVAPQRAWVWWADHTQRPYTWQNVVGFGGIISMIGIIMRGMPIQGGIVLVPAGDTVDDLAALARSVDRAVADYGGGWCPALVGDRDGSRLAISVQRAPDATPASQAAEICGIDDIVIVDPFGDRAYRTPPDPYILVRGQREGSGRTARTGRTAHASVPLPGDLKAFRARRIDEHPDAGSRP